MLLEILDEVEDYAAVIGNLRSKVLNLDMLPYQIPSQGDQNSSNDDCDKPDYP